MVALHDGVAPPLLLDEYFLTPKGKELRVHHYKDYRNIESFSNLPEPEFVFMYFWKEGEQIVAGNGAFMFEYNLNK